jgi:hypothetical protein
VVTQPTTSTQAFAGSLDQDGFVASAAAGSRVSQVESDYKGVDPPALNDTGVMIRRIYGGCIVLQRKADGRISAEDLCYAADCGFIREDYERGYAAPTCQEMYRHAVEWLEATPRAALHVKHGGGQRRVAGPSPARHRNCAQAAGGDATRGQAQA